LTASNAPSPSTILWENLECSWIESWLRTAFVTVLVIILLVISFLCIYFLKWSIGQLPNLSNCGSTTLIIESEYATATTIEKQCYCSNEGLINILKTSSIFSICYKDGAY